jgi:hypothetical protein
MRVTTVQLVKPLLETNLNFTQIGAQLGISRERVRQIAKESFGITGRVRHKIQFVQNLHRHTLGERKPCPKCGFRFAQKRGRTKLGADRMLCICGKSFIAGESTRPRVVMDCEFYRRLGHIGGTARWSKPGACGSPLNRLNYPYMLSADDGSELVQAVNSIVPRGLYDDCRADICQDILVAILEGELEREALSNQTVGGFITRWFRQRGRHVSLSEPRYDGDKTFGEVLGVY